MGQVPKAQSPVDPSLGKKGVRGRQPQPVERIFGKLYNNGSTVRGQREIAMADQRMLLVRRGLSLLDLWQDYRHTNLENVDSQIQFHKKLTELIRTHVNQDPARIKILEIGCGQRAPQIILFQAEGVHAIGIDQEVPTYHLSVKRFFRIIKINGWERALKSLFRHFLFDYQFFRQLARQAGKNLPPGEVHVCLMNAAQLAFPDNAFHFIFSSLVFEHINDVPATVAEVNRVLRPEGTAWINIHLFPSLSGGHHKDWTDPRKWPSSKVPPWDHLRQNRYPADTSLNKLRLGDYRRIFAESLEVLEETLVAEGEHILTPQLAAELARRGYRQDDLLVREVAFRCRKRQARA
jgi:SAM-dependent methyltransferase